MTVSGREEKAQTGISTHTPLAGRDNTASSKSATALPFLLTRPLRDVTGGISGVLDLSGQISTHTPLAGRDHVALKDVANNLISTHTPLAGRD